MKNKKFISYRSIVDAETGLEISISNQNINEMQKARIESHFIKTHERAFKNLKSSDIGRLSSLRHFIEWRTNRLVIKHVGRYPIPLKQKDIAEILDVTPRTVSDFFSNLFDVYAAFKIDRDYYLNPSFVGVSDGYDVDILSAMMEIDPFLENEINKKDIKRIKEWRRLTNLKW